MHKNPLVSVILPTHNGEKYINQSIMSVLNQTFKQLELIVINDGSTDKTNSIVNKILNGRRKFIYIKNKKNLGLIKTLNKGLKISRGKYIARIDDDDIWINPNKIEMQFNKLEHNNKLALIGTNALIVDNNDRLVKKTRLPESDKNIRRKILANNQYIHSSVMFRKETTRNKNRYKNDKYTQYVEDYELWLRLASDFKIANLKTICVKHRINKNGESYSKFYTQKWNSFKLALKYKANFPRSTNSLLIRSLRLLIPKNVSYFLNSI